MFGNYPSLRRPCGRAPSLLREEDREKPGKQYRMGRELQAVEIHSSLLRTQCRIILQ